MDEIRLPPTDFAMSAERIDEMQSRGWVDSASGVDDDVDWKAFSHFYALSIVLKMSSYLYELI